MLSLSRVKIGTRFKSGVGVEVMVRVRDGTRVGMKLDTKLE